MDPLEFPRTIEDDEEVEVEESDSDEEEVALKLLFYTNHVFNMVLMIIVINYNLVNKFIYLNPYLRSCSRGY